MKEFICIECPKGCHLQIDEALNVTGNTCIRGKNYAINEVTCPKRVITSTVIIESEMIKRLPVMSEQEIPKEKMLDVIKALNSVRVKAPIKCREIVVKDICGTGVNMIATRTILK